MHRVLTFYYPDCIDTRYGGYIAQLDERDGFVYDGQTKHLVATARAVHNFSVGALIDGPVWCGTEAEHGLHVENGKLEINSNRRLPGWKFNIFNLIILSSIFRNGVISVEGSISQTLSTLLIQLDTSNFGCGRSTNSPEQRDPTISTSFAGPGTDETVPLCRWSPSTACVGSFSPP